jgi:steroid delta-isomerase-like uncharacterized protein
MHLRSKLMARSLVAALALATGVGVAISRVRRRGRGSERRNGMLETNKDLARRLLVEVFDEGRYELIDELVSAGFVGHDTALPEPILGAEGLKESAMGYRSAFPDLRMTVDEQIAEGDRVVTRWTAHGTHESEIFGIAPTGKQATVTGITISRLSAGKVVEGRTNWDTLGLLQQLGVVPEPARA